METDDLIYEDLECDLKNTLYRNTDIIRFIEDCVDRKTCHLIDANLFELVAYQTDYFDINCMYARSFYLAMFSKYDELLYHMPFCMAKWSDGCNFMLINRTTGGRFGIFDEPGNLEKCIVFILAETYLKTDGIYKDYDHGFVVRYDHKLAVGKNVGYENNDFIPWVTKKYKDRMWSFTYDRFRKRVEKEYMNLLLVNKYIEKN